MPRPKNKQQLLDLSQSNYKKLLSFIDSLDNTLLSKTFPDHYLNRNIRDVLAHLHHWHVLVLGWYEEGLKGNKPHMPASGYTWRTVPELNKAINSRYLSLSLDEAISLLENSFQEIQGILKARTDEELFTKKYYNWTGSTSLASYMISATSSHYDWGLKLIKKGLKSN